MNRFFVRLSLVFFPFLVYADDSVICSKLQNMSVSTGKLSPSFPNASETLCCELCSQNSQCASAILLDGNCTLYDSINFEVASSGILFLPSAVTQASTAVPTTTEIPSPAPRSSNGLFAAWSRTGGTYEDSTDQPARYAVWDGVVTDSLTSMQWEELESTQGMNWSTAFSYCSACKTGGLTGWRLPNIGELQTLLDYTVHGPIPVNTRVFQNVSASDVWSSTADMGQYSYSWMVQFGLSGMINFDSVSTPDQVRCVRSLYPTPLANRYSISSGVVSDIVTGLNWQQHASKQTFVYSNAKLYCQNLDLGGVSVAWRLPTVKELSTLLDYDVSSGGLMMDPAVFNAEESGLYWSSTIAGSGFWAVDFQYGSIIGYVSGSMLLVRCVN
ncbi:MAG: DUF1566 domain-containing protein [Myxococcaceae bacterium]|nr:DUF1566 domain-containing protein [Myxococcaceae bacterium]MBH2006662.1 DUF1566 domain-containing protein [Myxococcaceae bacterium]